VLPSTLCHPSTPTHAHTTPPAACCCCCCRLLLPAAAAAAACRLLLPAAATCCRLLLPAAAAAAACCCLLLLLPPPAACCLLLPAAAACRLLLLPAAAACCRLPLAAAACRVSPADAISWGVLGVMRLTEEDTTSSSRIFIKYLFQVGPPLPLCALPGCLLIVAVTAPLTRHTLSHPQELSEYLGLVKLNQRLAEPSLQVRAACVCALLGACASRLTATHTRPHVT
jgi:hypothetical protein